MSFPLWAEEYVIPRIDGGYQFSDGRYVIPRIDGGYTFSRKITPQEATILPNSSLKLDSLWDN